TCLQYSLTSAALPMSPRNICWFQAPCCRRRSRSSRAMLKPRRRRRERELMLVDSHCHLDFPEFEAERNDIIVRAREAGVGLMVTISTRVRQFDRIRTIAETYDNVFCTVGTHPHNAGEEAGIPAGELIELSKHRKVVGIGEAGLDYHYDKAPRDLQAAGLRTHIEAARETGLPLVIHARQADEDMAQILEEEMGKGAFPFILHCFSSGPELARKGVELGGYVSFSGILTFKNSQEIRDIAKT